MSAGEAPPEAETAPAKKRKKKRKTAQLAQLAENDGSRALKAGGPRAAWPGFAQGFPDHPAVDALVVAFEQGNYAGVREGAKTLLERSADGASKDTKQKGEPLPHPLPSSPEERDAIRSAARELLRRTEPDPLAIYMVLGAFALLAFLSIWYWSHPHGAAP